MLDIFYIIHNILYANVYFARISLIFANILSDNAVLYLKKFFCYFEIDNPLIFFLPDRFQCYVNSAFFNV